MRIGDEAVARVVRCAWAAGVFATIGGCGPTTSADACEAAADKVVACGGTRPSPARCDAAGAQAVLDAECDELTGDAGGGKGDGGECFGNPFAWALPACYTPGGWIGDGTGRDGSERGDGGDSAAGGDRDDGRDDEVHSDELGTREIAVSVTRPFSSDGGETTPLTECAALELRDARDRLIATGETNDLGVVRFDGLTLGGRYSVRLVSRDGAGVAALAGSDSQGYDREDGITEVEAGEWATVDVGTWRDYLEVARCKTVWIDATFMAGDRETDASDVPKRWVGAVDDGAWRAVWPNATTRRGGWFYATLRAGPHTARFDRIAIPDDEAGREGSEPWRHVDGAALLERYELDDVEPLTFSFEVEPAMFGAVRAAVTIDVVDPAPDR